MDRLAVVRLERAVLALAGDDRFSFLQGLVSNDVERTRAGKAIWTALLTPQGKYLFDFFLYPTGDRLLLDVQADRAPELLRRLLMYRLRAKVEIVDVTDAMVVAAWLGGSAVPALDLPSEPGTVRAIADGVVAVEPRPVPLGARSVLAPAEHERLVAALGAADAPFEAWDRLRLRLGVPDGSRDLEIDKTTLMEAGFEPLQGLSFDKGCFVGQELTARMKYRGLAKRRLAVVHGVDTALPAPGTALLLDDREVGEMRSSLDADGLATLRTEVPAGAVLTGGGVQLRVASTD